MDEKIAQLIEKMKADNIKFIRLQFVDLHGIPKNVSIPCKLEDMEDIIKNGVLFDGSSIAGFVGINASDLVLKPDISTYSALSWRPEESASCRLICDIYTPDGKPFEGCPRANLKRVIAEAKELGFEMNVGPEAEFFLFINFDIHLSFFSEYFFFLYECQHEYALAPETGKFASQRRVHLPVRPAPDALPLVLELPVFAVRFQDCLEAVLAPGQQVCQRRRPVEQLACENAQ